MADVHLLFGRGPYENELLKIVHPLDLHGRRVCFGVANRADGMLLLFDCNLSLNPFESGHSLPLMFSASD